MSEIRLPAELPTDRLTAIIDTREQLPLDLSPLTCEVGTLPTGDYSLRGLEASVVVERKSLGDLVACCGRERDRFQRELDRLRAYPHKLLLVESSFAEIDAAQWRGKVTPRVVHASLVAWQRDGIPVCLAGNRERAGIIARDFLVACARRRWRELRELAGVVKHREGGR